MRVEYYKLKKILDFIEDNAVCAGGGEGFALSLWVPVDHESVTCGLYEAAQQSPAYNSVADPTFIRRAADMHIRNLNRTVVRG